MGGPNTTQTYVVSLSGRTLSELDTTQIRAMRLFITRPGRRFLIDGLFA